MNSDRWFFLAIATLVILTFGIYRFTAQGRYVFKTDSALVLDTWTGNASGVTSGKNYPFKHR